MARGPGVSATRLSADEHATLVAIARASIRERLCVARPPEETHAGPTLTPALLAPGAAFVTLKTPERPGDPAHLRGCIGTTERSDPLNEAVARIACDAAFLDPRFPPVTAAEIEVLEIEISVLGPLRRIDAPEEIEPGRHGVVLDKPPHHALFLPQVATEQGWGVTDIVEHLALKAGLRRDGWRGAGLSVFEAEVF